MIVVPWLAEPMPDPRVWPNTYSLLTGMVEWVDDYEYVIDPSNILAAVWSSVRPEVQDRVWAERVEDDGFVTVHPTLPTGP